MKHRLLYVWDADYPWDVRTEKIASALTLAGHEVHIAARNKAWRPTPEQLPEGTVHRMPPWRAVGQRLDSALSFPAFFSPRWLGLVNRVIRDHSIDAVIVRDLPLCPTAIWVAHRHGIPVIWDMAEDYPGMMRATWDAGRQGPFDFFVRNPGAVAAVERYCLPRLDRIVVTAREAADRIIGLGANPEIISIVHNTPSSSNASDTEPSHSRNPDAPIELVYLGLLETPRGIGELLEAVALLRSSTRRFRLTLIGGGRDESLLKNRAQELGLGEDEVTFTGFLPHAEALRRVAAADIGINPLQDTAVFQTCIPNKVFDYMAAGIPVVSSDMRACHRLLDETNAGTVFPSGNPAELARILETLSTDSQRRTLGENGRRAIRDSYNWESDSAVLEQTIRSAVGNATAAR